MRLNSKRKEKYLSVVKDSVEGISKDLDISIPNELVDEVIKDIERSTHMRSLSDRTLHVLHKSVMVKIKNCHEKQQEFNSKGKGKNAAKSALEATSWAFAAQTVVKEIDYRKFSKKIEEKVNANKMCQL